jgi:hypothetical protein
MNNLLKDLLRNLASCIGFVALVASSTFAQLNQNAQGKPTTAPRTNTTVSRTNTTPPHTDTAPPRADIVAPTAQGQLNPSDIGIRRGPAVAFRSPCTAPITGKAIPGDTLLTMPNGKQVTASQYCKAMDRFGLQLAQLGYTLGGSQPGRPKRIPLLYIKMNLDEIQRQQQNLASKGSAPNAQPLIFNQVVQKQQSIVPFDPGLIKAAVGINQPSTLHVVKTFDFPLGDPGKISISGNGKLEVNGTTTSTSLDAEANASGSLFGHSFDVLQLSGKVNSPKAGPLNINVSATMLGFNVYTLNENEPSALSKGDTISKTLDESTSVQFAIIGIPFSAKVGIHGTAGFTYSVSVAPVKATGAFFPSVNANAYAQVSIDSDVASAGIGGKLTFMNLKGSLTGDVAIVPDAKNAPTYSYDAQYCQTLDALDGSLFAFLKIGIDPFSTEIDQDLFTIPGIKSNGCFFSESKTVPVFTKPVATPGNK